MYSETPFIQRAYIHLLGHGESAVIPVRISKEALFFDTYDGLCLTLSPALTQYLDRCMVNLGTRKRVTVAFYCPMLSATRKEAVQSALHTCYALRLSQRKPVLYALLLTALLSFVLALLAAFSGGGWEALPCGTLFALCCAASFWLRQDAVRTHQLSICNVEFHAE